MDRNRYQESKKDDISVLDNKTYTIKNNDIHNIDDSYLLASPPRYLSHKQQKLRSNLKRIIFRKLIVFVRYIFLTVREL